MILDQPILRYLATYKRDDPGPSVTEIRDGVDHFEDMVTMWTALLDLEAHGRITKWQDRGTWRFRLNRNREEL